MQFSDLHVHTQFSLLNGAAPIQNAYKKAIAGNMPALAITDHRAGFTGYEIIFRIFLRYTRIVHVNSNDKIL